MSLDGTATPVTLAAPMPAASMPAASLPEAWFKTPRAVSVYGTELWDALDDAEARRLAFLETGYLWQRAVELLVFAASLRTGLLVRELTPKRLGIPGRVRLAWLEDTRSGLDTTLDLRQAMQRFAVPELPNGLQRARVAAAGLGWLGIATIAVVCEWFVAIALQEACGGDDVHAPVRTLARTVGRRSAETIERGAALIHGAWPDQAGAERDELLALVVLTIRVNLDEIAAHPDVLRAAGLAHPAFADPALVAERARRSAHRQADDGRRYQPIFRFLRDAAILGESSVELFARGLERDVRLFEGGRPS